jgi:hypothetical protein
MHIAFVVVKMLLFRASWGLYVVGPHLQDCGCDVPIYIPHRCTSDVKIAMLIVRSADLVSPDVLQPLLHLCRGFIGEFLFDVIFPVGRRVVFQTVLELPDASARGLLVSLDVLVLTLMPLG